VQQVSVPLSQVSPSPTISTAVLVAAGLAAAVVFIDWAPDDPAEGRSLSLALALGALFGIVLQRGRFCFLCNFRDLVDQRNPQGILAILIALASGAVLYHFVITGWMPVPSPDRLPPNAHIGPVGVTLAVSAFLFGLGMALSGSCLSAHLYRLGEGSFGSLVAIGGAAVGYFVALATWNSLYTSVIFDDPAVWLPQTLGYAGALAVTLAGLAVLALAALAVSRANGQPAAGSSGSLGNALAAVFVWRWPAAPTGLLVGAIAAIAYFRLAPLGVTAELGSLVRTAGTRLELLPETLLGLDTVRGCIGAIKTALLSVNGLFVAGLVLGSLSAALAAGQFRPALPDIAALPRLFTGGILMGFGAMAALGCTVGVLLSGIHAGALSGWVFLFFCTLGTFVGLKARKGLVHRG
jgi:uncharacterized membrane protein YedE/YeeE